ncbi:MAG: glycosyltransferase family 2 protein [Planctomycetales bacterium]|nr:glycosyltransferase family 2 protein [Planctomycetales bacterium]
MDAAQTDTVVDVNEEMLFVGDEEFSGLKNTVVIIPALNKESSIGMVLRDLPRVGLVIVVDSGSSDSTASIALALGATVIREDRRGYGQACLAGMRYLEEVAASLPSAPDYVAFLDADYSDHPNLLDQLIDPIHSGTADFVLGSRLLGRRERGAMPWQSVWGNKLAVSLIRIFWGYRYSDLGPFRAMHRNALSDLRMQECNFGWTVEMQIKAAVAHLRILEIPVPYRCGIGSSNTSGTILGSIKAAYNILYTIAKYRSRISPAKRDLLRRKQVSVS